MSCAGCMNLAANTMSNCPSRAGFVHANASFITLVNTNVATEMSAIPGILGSTCLNAFRAFICTEAIRGCVAGQPPLPACRSVCNTIQSSCHSFLLSFMPAAARERIRCSNFPVGVPGQTCAVYSGHSSSCPPSPPVLLASPPPPPPPPPPPSALRRAFSASASALAQ